MSDIDNRILIVDDTPVNLQLLGNTLKQKNYKVEFAIDGKKALDWIEKQVFDLILLDVMMPEMDGYEVCERIRKSDKHKKIPIIFLTAKTDTESVIKGFELGAQDYITKPFNTFELLARVKTQLELKSNREKLEGVNQWLEKKVQQRTVELIESNELLEKANTELLSLDKSKSEFLNIISHELRTPLNGILGTLYLLKDQVESKEMVKLINILDDSVNRLEKFSLMALQITSLRTKKHKLKNQQIKVEEIIDFCLIEHSQQIKNKKIDINLNNVKEDITINGDYDLLMTCFIKVFENAINHSHDNGKVFVKASLNSNGDLISCLC